MNSGGLHLLMPLAPVSGWYQTLQMIFCSDKDYSDCRDPEKNKKGNASINIFISEYQE
jgi:hypothetical protein